MFTGTEVMAQWLRTLSGLTEDPSLVPGIHVGWLKPFVTPAPQDLPTGTNTHMHLAIHTYIHAHIIFKRKIIDLLFFKAHI